MVAAGVRNHSALSIFGREGSDFVIGSAQFESTNGLLVFRLEKKPASVGFRMIEFDEEGAGGDALQARLSFSDVGKGDHAIFIIAYHEDDRERERIDIMMSKLLTS